MFDHNIEYIGNAEIIKKNGNIHRVKFIHPHNLSCDDDVVIADPREDGKFSVDQLKEMGIYGVYKKVGAGWPIDAKERLQHIEKLIELSKDNS